MPPSHPSDAPQVDIQKFVIIMKRNFGEQVANLSERLAMTIAYNEQLEERVMALEGALTAKIAESDADTDVEDDTP
jgi:hypothetical protein